MKKQIKSLFDASIPQSSLPFIINVLKCQHEGGLEASAACQILHNLECFFVRRSICGHEPSGLHAVFKRLWGDLDKRTAGEVIRRIRSLPTVKVPEDNEVREHVRKTQMYKKGIAHFFISEYDKSLGGEIPSDQFQLEHVLPQTMTEAWAQHFSREEHEALVHTAANLLPVTQTVNATLAQKPFIEKKDLVKTNSMFKSTRDFCEKYSAWTPLELEKRANNLADWAVDRWKFRI